MNLQRVGYPMLMLKSGGILGFYGMLKTEVTKELPLVADDAPER